MILRTTPCILTINNNEQATDRLLKSSDR